MLNTYQDLITGQYEACLSMLGMCVNRSPDSGWHAPVANLKFCQVAFHTLFFTDLYLGDDVASQRAQSFHRDHSQEFGDYEELEDRVQQATYEKSFIIEFLRHCRDKAISVVGRETEETLQRRAAFDWLDMTRAELHLYNVRHIHHHAAQLSLRMRLDTGEGIPWVQSGWREV